MRAQRPHSRAGCWSACVAASVLALAGLGCGPGVASVPVAVDPVRIGGSGGQPSGDAALPREAGAPDASITDAPAETSVPDDAGVEAPPIDAPPADAPAEAAPALPASTSFAPCKQYGVAWPRALAHTPDGKSLSVGYAEGTFITSDVAGTREEYSSNHEKTILKVAHAPDGSHFAHLAHHHVRLTSADDKRVGSTFVAVREGRVLQLSPRARLLLIVGEEQNLRINLQVYRWDQALSELPLTLVDERMAPAQASFAADGQSLLLLHGGKTLETVALGAPAGSKVELEAPIELAVFSSDGRLVAGVTADNQVALFDVATGKARWRVPADRGARPEQLLFLGSTRRVVALAGPNAVIHDETTGAVARTLALPRPLVTADGAPDGSVLAGATDDGRVIRVRVADGMALPAPNPRVRDGFGEFDALAFAPNGRYLAASTGFVTIWDLISGHIRWNELNGVTLTFSPSGEQLAAAGVVRCTIQRLEDGSTTEPPFDRCKANLVFSPTGALLAGVTGDQIGVFRPDGSLVRPIPSQIPAPGVGFSPDGAWLASTGNEMWSTVDFTRRWRVEPEPGTSPATEFSRDHTVEFTPDGRLVLLSQSYKVDPSALTATWKTRTVLRDAATGKLEADFGDKLGRHPSLSPDGAWITAGPTVLHVASATTRTLAPDTRVSVFLPDGRIAGGSLDGTVTFYCPKP